MNLTKHKRLAIAASIVLACGTAAAQSECSAGILYGSYVFSASGWGVPTGVWAPKAIVEYIRFNGDGTLVVAAATVANRDGSGAVVQVPAGGTGSYALDAACTGTLVFHNGPSFNFVTSPKGDELWMIQTNPGNVLQGMVKRLTK
jgi:hypothetical protein